MSESISNYRILKKLGAGGMGEVYLAEDKRLGRSVALKILPAAVSHERDRMRRFIHEARAAAALHHPHIVHIYDVGEANGTHFIAMEYVEGRTLDTHINGRPLSKDEIIRIGVEAADAVAAAHSKGITHRDIKPSNIIVTPHAGAKVLDFGLAKITIANTEAGASDVSTALKTSPGVILGTLAYMSPEQAFGREVDHRTDIFSLGAVLYEMATGRRPFMGQTANETIDQIAHSQPEAISRFNYAIPQELERIIRKCLEKDKERRYQTAQDLVIDLKNLQRDSMAESTAQDVKESTRVKWNVSVPRILLVAVALAVLVAIAIGVYWFKGPSSRTKIDSIAVLPFANVGADADTEYLSDGVTEALINKLSQLSGMKVIARNSVFRYKGRHVEAPTVGRELGVEAVLTGRIARRGEDLLISLELVDARDNTHLWGEQYTRRFGDILGMQGEIVRDVSERLRLRMTSEEEQRLARRPTEIDEAYQLYLRGRYFWNKRTEEGMRRGVDYFRQAIELDASYSLAYAGLADSYNFLGAFGIAVLPPGDAMPKAKAAAMKALDIDDSLAEAHTSLAFVRLYYDWDWAAADRGFQRAIELNPNYAPAHQWYSHLLMTRKKTSESIAKAKRATEIDPLSLPAHMNLGWQYHWARQYDLAVDQLRRALEIDSRFEQAHWGLGLAYEQKGMFEEAVAEFQKAMGLSGGGAVYKAALAHAYAVMGKRVEALTILKELEELSSSAYVPPYWMATVYAGLRDREQTFKWLEKAYEERSGGLIWLDVDPRLDGVRSDRRFTALMQRVTRFQ
ncbi:MAG TPA: protein kinase [Pyrinomonadaceae bacterium]|nr:protein kinase [Pyrinomonadaceae bacterium]